MDESVAQPSVPSSSGPLAGVVVLELGQLVAGPFASSLLAWFGAEVIKVEPPRHGDALRGFRGMHEGTSLWWATMARNKKCITLDLRTERGQDMARRLAARADVLIENFRPGTLEKWGLGEDALRRDNPGLIVTRVSGWGQTGPMRAKPGYAAVAEGFAGMRYVNGFADRPPARANLSLGDTITGLHAALGVLVALYARDARAGDGREPGATRGSAGQMVDVAIYESVFNMMESAFLEYQVLGQVRERLGSRISGIVPSNIYACGDGRYIIIGGNGDSIFKRLMRAAGRPDMAEDPRLAHNPGRVANEAEIDGAIAAWTGAHDFDHVLACLERAEVPAGPINSMADIAQDAQFRARGVFESATLDDGTAVEVPTMAPRLSRTPGATRWLGKALGAHNREIYEGMLGLSAEELRALERDGVI